MLDRREVVDSLLHLLRLDTCRQRSQSRRHSVVSVVQALNLHLRGVNLNALLTYAGRKLAIAQQEGIACTAGHSLTRRKGQLSHRHRVLIAENLLRNNLIISRIDESRTRMLILHNAHLRVNIVLETVVVAVQMVGGDIHQNGHIGTEVVHSVQLERTQLQNIPLTGCGGHLKSETLAYITAQTNVTTRIAHNLIDERGRGGLAI